MWKLLASEYLVYVHMGPRCGTFREQGNVQFLNGNWIEARLAHVLYEQNASQNVQIGTICRGQKKTRYLRATKQLCFV